MQDTFQSIHNSIHNSFLRNPGAKTPSLVQKLTERFEDVTWLSVLFPNQCRKQEQRTTFSTLLLERNPDEL